MGITIIGVDGEPESLDGGPFQYTAGGRPTGLATNSVPISQYRGGASTWSRMYREQPWVRACVDKLTLQVSRLPLGVFAGDRLNPQPVLEGPLHDAITRPAERAGPINLKQWLIKPALIHGKSPLQIVRGRAGAPPSGFRRLFPQWLSARSGSGIPGDVDWWEYRPPNQPQPDIIQPRDLLMIAWETDDASFGSSPLRPLLATLVIEAAARAYQQNLLRNGVRPPGGVSWSDANPEVIALAENKEFRREFEEEMTRSLAGYDNAGKPVFMPPGAKWMSFAYTSSEAELIQQRHLTREEVGAVYDLKPPHLGLLAQMNAAAVAALLPDLFQTTLPPWLSLIRDCFGAQVIDPHPTFAGQWVQFDLRDVLRGDPVKDATARKTDLMSGVLTINESRGERGLAPIDHPDANRPLIPTNNLIFLGDSPSRDNAASGTRGNPDQAALAAAISRAGDRVYRRLKAGATTDEAWDPERFERELAEDLEAGGANGTSAQKARAWAGAMTALVADAGGDPDVLRTNLVALNPQEAT